MGCGKFEELLSIIPEYWAWREDLDSRMPEEQEKFRLFFKHAPEFWEMFDYRSTTTFVPKSANSNAKSASSGNILMHP